MLYFQYNYSKDLCLIYILKYLGLHLRFKKRATLCVQPHGYSNLACIRLHHHVTPHIQYLLLKFIFFLSTQKNEIQYMQLKQFKTLLLSSCSLPAEGHSQPLSCLSGLGLLSSTSVQSQLGQLVPWLLVHVVVQSLMENSCRNLQLLNCYSCFQIIASSVGLWYKAACRPRLFKKCQKYHKPS